MEIKIIIIAAIIQLVTLIVFFVMAANIDAIKKIITPKDISISEYFRLADEERYIGNKDKEREYLLRAKYRCEITNAHNVLVYSKWVIRTTLIAHIERRLTGDIEDMISETEQE